MTFNSSGGILPSIHWTSGGIDVTGDIVPSSSANLIESVYIVTAGPSNISSYKCEVNFRLISVSGAGEAVSQHIPTYPDSHSFAEIVVTCKLLLQAVVDVFCTCNLYSISHAEYSLSLIIIFRYGY